jgi:hypothetical protein
MFQTKVVEEIKIHSAFSIFFFNISCYENVEKYCRAGQDTDDIMAHTHFMLDAEGYKFTHLEYVILIASPQQQWLHGRASV